MVGYFEEPGTLERCIITGMLHPKFANGSLRQVSAFCFGNLETYIKQMSLPKETFDQVYCERQEIAKHPDHQDDTKKKNTYIFLHYLPAEARKDLNLYGVPIILFPEPFSSMDLLHMTIMNESSSRLSVVQPDTQLITARTYRTPVIPEFMECFKSQDPQEKEQESQRNIFYNFSPLNELNLEHKPFDPTEEEVVEAAMPVYQQPESPINFLTTHTYESIAPNERLDYVHENFIKPLTAARKENNFAELSRLTGDFSDFMGRDVQSYIVDINDIIHRRGRNPEKIIPVINGYLAAIHKYRTMGERAVREFFERDFPQLSPDL